MKTKMSFKSKKLHPSSLCQFVLGHGSYSLARLMTFMDKDLFWVYACIISASNINFNASVAQKILKWTKFFLEKNSPSLHITGILLFCLFPFFVQQCFRMMMTRLKRIGAYRDFICKRNFAIILNPILTTHRWDLSVKVKPNNNLDIILNMWFFFTPSTFRSR